MNRFKRSLVISVLTILPLTSHAIGLSDLSLKSGLDWGVGRLANSDSSIRARTLNTAAFHVMPGYKLGDFAPSLFAEYRIAGQNSDPASVGNTNTRGHGYLLGAGTTYRWHSFTVTGVGYFLGQYSLFSKSTAGESTSYGKPLGFLASVSYDAKALPLVGSFIPEKFPMSVDLSYRLLGYGESTIGTTTTSISSNKISHWSAAVGVSVYPQF